MTTHTIDVLIPVHNGADYIAAAIDSVRKQTFTDYGIIVIDDASTDGSADIARSYDDVTVLQPGRVRQSGALNAGLKFSSAPFVAFLDADDLWTPEKLEIQLNYLTDHPKTDGVFGATRQFISGPDQNASDSMQWQGDSQLGLLLPTLLMRRDSFDKVGFFNEDHNVNSFLEWYSRAQVCRIVFDPVPETVLYRRVHAQNMTRVDRTNVVKGYMSALRTRLNQQRTNSDSDG